MYSTIQVRDFDAPNCSKRKSKDLRIPLPEFSMLDKARTIEIDDFYRICQQHRDQYKDQSGCLHPMDYFRTYEIKYSVPSDLTGDYLRSPMYFCQYKSPQCFPLTYGRTYRP